MKERATLILSEEQIKKILFFHYLAELDSKTNDDIFNNLEFVSKIKYDRKGTHISFILEYKKHIESFDGNITKEFIVSIEDLNNIINERLIEEEYEIESLEEHLLTDENSIEPSAIRNFKYIKYNLKKKQKVKTKKKGWR